MGSGRLSERILAVLRSSFGPSIGVVRVRTDDGHDLGRIDATDAEGERWGLMGCDLEG